MTVRAKLPMSRRSLLPAALSPLLALSVCAATRSAAPPLKELARAKRDFLRQLHFHRPARGAG